MDTKPKLEELLKKFGEKNASFVRNVMENHHLKADVEASQGTITKVIYKEIHTKEI